MMQSNIPIKDLFQYAPFKDADLISTSLAIDHTFTNCTIMDLPTIDEWIQPYELLIIGNFMETHFTKDFLLRLKDKKIAAIITKKKI